MYFNIKDEQNVLIIVLLGKNLFFLSLYLKILTIINEIMHGILLLFLPPIQIRIQM